MAEQRIIYNPDTYIEDLKKRIGRANYDALYEGQLLIQVRCLKSGLHTYKEIAEILNKSKVPSSYQNKNKRWTDKRVGIVLRRYMKLMNLEEDDIRESFPDIDRLYKDFIVRHFSFE
ncbi:hypothetical protein [Emticicia fluvialis]|uniref:hypothetical protein n=1 Tax=Emticicia fluvialis TaxID=2974474 RepID=UPI002165A423|nr:hypothetical protein [Emticicia fluvialis]